MDRTLPRLALVALVLGAVAGLFVTWESSPPEPTEASVVPAPEPERAPEPEEGSPEERLAQLDHEIAALRPRAEAGSWLDYESIAHRYLARYQLTGSYDDFRGADEALQAALRIAPSPGGPFMLRMTLDFSLHRIAAVEEQLAATSRIAVIQPHDQDVIDQLRAEVAFYSGRYDEARERFEQRLQEHRDVETLVALAQYRWRTGDREGADLLLTEAEGLEHVPRSTRGWLCLVRALFEIDGERWDAADAAIERGLELRPGWWQLEEHSAQLLRERGALGDARLLYESIEARIHSPEMLDALALIATEERRLEDAAALTAEARALHEERLALFPEAAAGHALDHFLVLEDDAARAIEIAGLNAHARPFGEAQAKLAIAHARGGQWDEAAAIVYALEETPWSTPESEAISAIVLAHQGDEERAAQHRERATRLAPGALERVEAMLR